MTEKQRYVIYAIVGCVILVAFLSTRLRGMGGDHVASPGSPDAPPPVLAGVAAPGVALSGVPAAPPGPVPAAGKRREVLARQARLLDLPWGPDPFRAPPSPVPPPLPAGADDGAGGPEAASDEVAADPALSGVSLGKTRAFAVLDGKVVALGEAVEGWVLEKVFEDRVLVRKGRQTRTIPLAARREP